MLKGQGSCNLVQNMGDKGPVLRLRCIGPRRARTQILFNSISGQWAMNMGSNFTRMFPPWKCGTKASGVPTWWLNIAGHLEETFHGQNIGESHPLLIFIQYFNYLLINTTTGKSNGKLPLRTRPGCSVPEPHQSPDSALVSAQTGPRAEYL